MANGGGFRARSLEREGIVTCTRGNEGEEGLVSEWESFRIGRTANHDAITWHRVRSRERSRTANTRDSIAPNRIDNG